MGMKSACLFRQCQHCTIRPVPGYNRMDALHYIGNQFFT
jgi:hypothetical protein